MKLGPIIVLNPQGEQIVGARCEVFENLDSRSFSLYVRLPSEFDLELFKAWQEEVRSAPTLAYVMYNWHKGVA